MGLAKGTGVKKIVIYRTITVAIGILVAVVIALTLWIRSPRQTPAPEAPAAPQSMLHDAKSLFKAAISIAEAIRSK